MKWPKMRIRRIDMERVLIGCSAVLVLLLSVGGRNGENEPYEERLEEIPQGEVAVSATEKDMQQTVVYYEDGDGYLVPVQRDIIRQDGIAKATLELMVSSARNDMDAARLGLSLLCRRARRLSWTLQTGMRGWILAVRRLRRAINSRRRICAQPSSGR